MEYIFYCFIASSTLS